MGRLVGIDYGERRVGIAVSDPLQIIANGLTTVETGEALAFIRDYASREEVACFVIGRPMTLQNAPAAITEKLDAFARRLQAAVPGVPIAWVDERYTSLLAQRAMVAGGMKKMERREKGRLDSIAAALILQTYMESRRVKNNDVK